MIKYVLMATCTGVGITLAQALSARLSTSVGIIRSSIFHHFVGMIFLLFILALGIYKASSLTVLSEVPMSYYFGGVLGVIIIASYNSIIPKIGPLKNTVIVIAGQSIMSLTIDLITGKASSPIDQTIGIFFVLLGIFLPYFKFKKF